MEMLAKTKKIYAILSILFLLVSYVFSPAYAVKASENTNEISTYVQISQDTAPVKNAETAEVIGELTKGLILKAAKLEGDRVYFQWGKELAYIDATNTQTVDPSQPFEAYSYDTNDSTIPCIQTKEKTAIRSQANDIIGYLIEGSQYPIFRELENSFEIIIGNQLAYIEKSPAITVVQNEETNPASTENKSNTQTNATNQVDSTSNQQSNATEEKSEATQVKTQPSTTTRASIASIEQTEATTFTASTKYFKVTTDKLAIYDNSTGTLVQVGSLEKGQEFPRVKDYGNWHQIQFGTKYAYVWKGSTAPSDGKSPMKLGTQPSGTAVFTATADLPVYDNSTGTLIHIATIKQGQSYPIVRDYGNWYEILISGRIGYVHKSGTRIDFKSSDRYFRVITDHLAVYDNSTGTLVQVGSLEKGQEFPRVKDYGNWHQIKYGKGYGFVWKASTEPSNGATIQNINSLAPSGKTFTTITDVPVYDNSSGQLVKFATIQKGVSYPILKDYGNWYVVDVAGRTGYVHKSGVKLSFTSTDRYFEVMEDRVPIYDNSTGKLVPVAYLEKGQVFPRLRDFGNWHEVKYGRSVGYVWKESTRPPFSVNLKNENNGTYKPTDRNFLTLVDAPVVDNSSGSLVQFATIKEGQSYPIIKQVGNWIEIELAGRIGYVYKDKVHVGPIIRYTQYNLSLEEMLNIQMTKKPQTDLYRNAKSYVHSDYIQVAKSNTFPTKGTVTATTLNVREGAGTTYWVVGTLKLGDTVDVVAKVGDWYEIKFGPWKNAKPEDVQAYLDPSRFSQDSKEYFQFLVLSESAGVPLNDLNNKILANKGILAGKGQAFIDAGAKYHINEIYLISHALLETGNGTSALANGVLVDKVDGKPVEPKKVYNMYGIGAYDSCPVSCGAEYAYKQGWFTPEAAIIGGAGYIASQYINNPTYKQDTLYKMRWNPANPGVHQYATDIGWAVKQVRNISQLYDLLDTYTLIFDVPVYK
ncbi:SH3 domain-containing protein [Anoxybacillus caldiproteolyticus]|nr:SH3 domain-containing protein [Anoxybacillus caldiproteolyticus]